VFYKIGDTQIRFIKKRKSNFHSERIPTRRIRIRPDLVAAFAAGHPAPVVGPSAAAGLEAVVAAAAAPSELDRSAAWAAGRGVGVVGATVEPLAGTRLIPPLFRPAPGPLSVAVVVSRQGLAIAVSALAASGGIATATAAATAAGPSQPGCLLWGNGLQ
jgi:hypothetical protein